VKATQFRKAELRLRRRLHAVQISTITNYFISFTLFPYAKEIQKNETFLPKKEEGGFKKRKTDG
jgi:hypothetical protein